MKKRKKAQLTEGKSKGTKRRVNYKTCSGSSTFCWRFIKKKSQMYDIETVYSTDIYRATTSTLNREKVIPENTSPPNTAYIFSREGGKGEGTAEGKLT